jgi:phage terminase large subunit-like protein
MKTWQKIKKLRKFLNEITPEIFARKTDSEKEEILNLRRAERLYTYQYDFFAFIGEVMQAETRGEPPCKLGTVHKDLCRFLRSSKNLGTNALIMVPRYHLKTQIATIYYRIWRLLHDPDLCSLIVSGTLELSKSTARAVRHELQNNENLRNLYVHILPDWIFNDRKNKWSETQFNVARNKNYPQCTIEAVGVEATVTGKHFGEITMDDIVTPENSTTPEQCQKVIQAYKYFCSIINPKCGRFVVVGTPYTDNDLYSYIRDPSVVRNFRTFIRPVYDSLGDPIWPGMYDREKLQEIASQQGIYTFNTQYLLDPVPEEMMEFKKQWLQIYRDLPKDVNGNDITTTRYVIVDPITAKPTSSTSKDRGVVLVVGVDKAGTWYVLDYKLYDRAKEAELFHGIFEKCDRWSTSNVGWETVAYQLQGRYNLEEEAKRTGRRLRITELRPGHTKKDVRIRSLIPYFERGQIFIKPWMSELLHELYRFPHGETKDILDALAYMIKMIPVKSSRRWRGDGFPKTDSPERQIYF